MAETAAPKGKKKPTKVVVYSVLGLGAAGLAYWLYTKYAANQGTAASTAIPADTTPPASTTLGTPATPAYGSLTTLAAWKAAVLQYMTTQLGIKGGENTAATGLAAALSGHCVGPAEFAALNSTFAAIGQPPGGNTIILKQCGGSASAPTTTGHTPTSAPATPAAKVRATATRTATSKRAAPHRPGANRRANLIDAARRRANNAAAAARRRANNVARAAASQPEAPNPNRPKGPKVPVQVSRPRG